MAIATITILIVMMMMNTTTILVVIFIKEKKEKRCMLIDIAILSEINTIPRGGGYSLIWAIWGYAAGQGMVFWPRCPKQGVQFDLALS